MIFTILSHLAGTLALTLACSPVYKSWQPVIPGTSTPTPGSCLPSDTFFYVLSAVTIVCDVVVFLTPIPLLLKLQINLRRKIGLVGIFLLGLFTTVCSVLRMIQITQISKDGNSTGLILWGVIELNVGVCADNRVCLCLLSDADHHRRYLSPASPRSRRYSPSFAPTWASATATGAGPAVGVAIASAPAAWCQTASRNCHSAAAPPSAPCGRGAPTARRPPRPRATARSRPSCRRRVRTTQTGQSKRATSYAASTSRSRGSRPDPVRRWTRVTPLALHDHRLRIRLDSLETFESFPPCLTSFFQISSGRTSSCTITRRCLRDCVTYHALKFRQEQRLVSESRKQTYPDPGARTNGTKSTSTWNGYVRFPAVDRLRCKSGWHQG